MCNIGAASPPTRHISHFVEQTVCELIWSLHSECKCVFIPLQAQQGMHVAGFQQDRSISEESTCSVKHMVPKLMSKFAQRMRCAVNARCRLGRACMSRDPKERPTFEEVSRSLKHMVSKLLRADSTDISNFRSLSCP